MMVRVATILSTLILLFGLPLLGVILAGEPVGPYLEFPPTTRDVGHEPFSWTAFVALFLFVSAAVVPFLVLILDAPKPLHVYLVQQRPFPWWGWLGTAFLALAWTLAWTRLSWFAPWQPFTFTPLWIGYIVIVNAITFKRTGHCLMLDRPGYFLALFPASALFWWFFEYMNRFVQNWYYVGIADLGPVEYFWHATLPFATVLPAVLSTIECLSSFPKLDGSFRDLWAIEVAHPTALGWAGLLLAGGSLAAISVWPAALFPLVWISPLIVITSLQSILGEETLFDGLKDGDWRAIWLPALAGLICGVFWEMWNSQSLAHWEYAIPYVHRFQIFEMPVLGYAGYLPFGMECVAVAQLITKRKPVLGPSP